MPQGLPYFSGTGSYTQVIDVPADYVGKALFLRASVGADVLEVDVNGRFVGTCLWNPYVLDISDYIMEGKNEITLRVVNTVMNILEGTRNKSGLFDASITACDRYELKAE